MGSSASRSRWCVPGCQFPERGSQRVDLFVDGKDFFASVFEAIERARSFVYITGWSFHPEMKIIEDVKIGELLKRRAEEGIVVCIHLWQVPSVVEDIVITYNSYALKYFEGSKVDCFLSQPIDGSVLLSLDAHKSSTRHFVFQFANLISQSEVLWSHHQKTVVCDAGNAEEFLELAPGSPPRQRFIPWPFRQSKESCIPLVAFCGGLDLTLGRWDTAEHSLFSLSSCQSFYNQECSATGVSPNGWPRQPWHDVGCRIIGSGALDVLKNFEERWIVGKWSRINRWLHIPLLEYMLPVEVFGLFSFAPLASLMGREFDELSHLSDMPEDLSQGGTVPFWRVQVFRSLTKERLIFGDPVESDIHRAYLHTIEKSEKFVYIENQFFFGSSERWNDGFWPRLERAFWKGTVRNRVPGAVVDRIKRAIRRNEEFRAYIIIPLFPEGDPEHPAALEMMRWLFRTVSMMYSEIHAEIVKYSWKRRKSNRVVDVPTDYLGFYFLGKVEPSEASVDVDEAELSGKAQVLQRTRRYPIYVHSKCMVADDSYALMGSANLNDRSLMGDRDTELVVGLSSTDDSVLSFRRRLWTEHFGSNSGAEGWMNHPEQFACKEEVDRRARENWAVYCADEPHVLPFGHVCPYPIRVDEAGICEGIELPDAAGVWTDGRTLSIPALLMPKEITT